MLIGIGFEDAVSEKLEHALSCGIMGLVCDQDSAITPSHFGVDMKGPRGRIHRGVLRPRPVPLTAQASLS